MADQPTLTRVEDPLQHLRAAVDAHAKATQASVDAGAAVQADREQPAPAPEQAQ